MKSFFVRDLLPNQVMTTTFLVHTKDVRQKKSGEPYLSLLLGDRTGEVDAKMWDNVAEVMDTFDRDDFVKVKGLLQIFQNRPQLTIHKMARLQDSDVNLGDYFPSSERNPDEMFAELRGIISDIRNPHLHALLDAFMDDEKIARMYRSAPAAKTVHHAFLGGLLEHALSVCQLCRATASHYKGIDVDLLMTGAILHDVGKTTELSYERTFGYSTGGQLLGHIAIGMQMLNDKIARIPDFPPKLRILLEHMILSHHGELEYGSPKVPVFPEALLLHHLDNLDSKMECMRAAIARDRNVDGCWTAYNAALDRAVLKKARFLDEGGDEGVTEPASQAPAEPVSQNGTGTEPAGSPVVSPDAPELHAVETPQPGTTEPRRAERAPSAFAEKLQQAWRSQ
ncbi:MAG: HD domain-containing protein [Bryobacteraceae bacterium]|jgi:3'-5' exoribonuclease